jgi:mannose-6-phosphate isomerase-like protein (cupin superfamily)
MTIGSQERPAGAEQGPAFKGTALVLQPDEGPSYWQPMPANGYATVKISPDNCAGNFVSMGIQVIGPGSYVREHWHSKHEEILFCFEGSGEVLVDGVLHPFTPGTTVYVGRWVRHKINNTGAGELKMTWTYLPPGLQEFMAAIGQPRRAGEPAPAPFARPGDVLQIEKQAGFGPKIGA